MPSRGAVGRSNKTATAIAAAPATPAAPHVGLAHRGELLTEGPKGRLERLFAVDRHAPVQITWALSQRMLAAARHPTRSEHRTLITTLIDSLATGVPAAGLEPRHLNRTLHKRSADILASFDRPHTSHDPTEAINARLEHLRGSALGLRNLTTYIARCLLAAGGFRPRRHPRLCRAGYVRPARSAW